MNPKPRLVVIGSANMDLVVRTDHIPVPGETVLGGAFTTVPGGKGANQAVAAAKLGADVRFVGRVGCDAFGDALLVSMRAAGILDAHIVRDPDEATGVALICVDRRAQNTIVVAPGANHALRPADVNAAAVSIAAADAIVIQLEIPLGTVAHAIHLACRSGVKVILNPAPIRHTEPLPDSLLAGVDILTPNEHEAAALLGYASPDGLIWEEAARGLLAKGVRAVVITLGAEGCLIAAGADTVRIPAVAVEAVDTTAAGDCFTGALAVALAEGAGLHAAAVFASRAAAVSVTRLGAQSSLPTREEITDGAPFPARNDLSRNDPKCDQRM